MKIRKAFVMSVNPSAEHEYEKRHNPIWPELEKVLKDHGVSNYSIFLHPETRQLLGESGPAIRVRAGRFRAPFSRSSNLYHAKKATLVDASLEQDSDRCGVGLVCPKKWNPAVQVLPR